MVCMVHFCCELVITVSFSLVNAVVLTFSFFVSLASHKFEKCVIAAISYLVIVTYGK